jgi:hypothetical protein
MPKKMSSVQYKRIRREDIGDFLNELAECQNYYIELAVEQSGYKDAKEVLQYIMEKK